MAEAFKAMASLADDLTSMEVHLVDWRGLVDLAKQRVAGGHAVLERWD